MITGGADSVLNIWSDVTQADIEEHVQTFFHKTSFSILLFPYLQAAHIIRDQILSKASLQDKAAQERALKEQSLSSALRRKDYAKVICRSRLSRKLSLISAALAFILSAVFSNCPATRSFILSDACT